MTDYIDLQPHIATLKATLTELEEHLLSGIAKRPEVLDAIKTLHMALRHLVADMQEQDFQLARNGRIIDVSDTMPCLFCGDYYATPDENVKGLRYEPIPGKGYVYLCWECCCAFKDVLDGQFNGMTYSFLFSLSENVKKLRDDTMKDNDGFAGELRIDTD